MGRTYFIDPKPKQKNEYQAVVDAQAAAIAALVDGAKMSSAYEAAISVLNDKNMVHLAEKIPKNVGHVVGLELRDSTNALNATNSNLIKAGMTFNVSIGKAIIRLIFWTNMTLKLHLVISVFSTCRYHWSEHGRFRGDLRHSCS